MLKRNAALLWSTGVAFVIVLLIAGVGVLFYYRSRHVMEAQLRQQLLDTTSVAAMQFSADDVQKAIGQKKTSPAVRDLIMRLREIRENIPLVRYAYIMRRTKDPRTLEFVADADSLATESELDRNGNGRLDEDEQPSMPGDKYDIRDVPAMQRDAFLRPTVEDAIVQDKWGFTLSGYAPIRAADGTVVAILGLDLQADTYIQESQSIVSPAILLLVALAASFVAALLAVSINRRRYELLERVENERTGLLQLTYHQLGTPLTVFRWSLEALKDQRGKPGFEEAVNEHIADVEDGITRMSGIVDMLREADRVHAGTIAYQPELTSLDEVVQAVAAEFKSRSERQKIALVLKLHDGKKMNLDRQLISGVLRELLGNAFDYSPSNTTITVTTAVTDKQAQVDIADEGIGIPRPDMPRIFNEFARGGNAWNYNTGGAGLGLYIAKGVVDQAGGEIWVKSMEGKGSTFSFTLPVQ